MINPNHATPVIRDGQALPALRISIARVPVLDHRYLLATWQESYKQSDASLLRMPWPPFKQTVGRELARILESTHLLGAYVDDGRMAGWMAYTPGRAVDTLHWIYTRVALPSSSSDGQAVPCRNRGVMRALLDHAGIGTRIAYTHRGPRPISHRGRKSHGSDAIRSRAHGESSDVALAEWLRSTGRVVTFVPYEEWSK